MSSYDPHRTLKARELLRLIAEKIAAGAEFSNTEGGRKSSEFYQRTRERAKLYAERTVITEPELEFLRGIEVRMKTRKRK